MSISSARTATLLFLSLCATWPAAAGRKNREEVPAPVVVVPEPVQPSFGEIFDAPLPLDIGPRPDGLASLSAQGCNACHFSAHDGWAQSGHATGYLSTAFLEAVSEIGTPACTVCHLPLAAQHAELVTFDAGDVNRPIGASNPHWDATLQAEGVTCAACHVRDGQVIGAQPSDRPSPHPQGWSEQLRSSTLCATCHQLTWPGAAQPFYDTWGEWKRSPQAAAGIQCQDCHMGPGAAGGQLGTDHRFTAAAGRGISVLTDLNTDVLIRGGEAIQATVALQNTGAGHAYPTGSPFRGIRMEIFLEGPVPEAADADGPARVAVQTVDLARTLDGAMPFDTLSDTRLGPGEEREWAWQGALPDDAAAGPWFFVVLLTPTARGVAVGAPVVQRRIPCRVQ